MTGSTARFLAIIENPRSLYEALVVTPDKRVIPYYSTGVRSARTYFTLPQLGYKSAALFTSSYVEWISGAIRPITTGNQP